MLVEIQVNKTEKKVYALDEDYQVIAQFPCSTDFVEGYNEDGLPYCNAEDGQYDDTVYAEAYGTDSQDVVYGWAYINIDERGHALHGGRNLEAYQDSLKPTLGCFRMYNSDVLWLALKFLQSKEQGINPCITVIS